MKGTPWTAKAPIALFLFWAALHACAASEDSRGAGEEDGGSGGGDTDGDGDGDTDPDAGADGDADGDGDAGANPTMEAPATCEEAVERRSNIGCEYWAADLDTAENYSDNAAGGQFAVAVANIGEHGAAEVKVHINNAPQGEALDLELVESREVPERDLHVFKLPRRDVDGDNIKKNVDDGPQTWLSSRAFRITSSLPVVAYQFNPLGMMSSNDASLLLPSSGLGMDHLVLGYHASWPNEKAPAPYPAMKNHAYVTILGVTEGTQVDVVPSFDILEGEGVDAIPAGEKASFTIGPFDVINLETDYVPFNILGGGPKADLTGTRVLSDAPVAVFFGTDQSMIATGDSPCCNEHIEQQVLPSEAMGLKFVVSHSAKRNAGFAENDFYRIMAYSDDTVVTTSSPIAGTFALDSGGYREFFSPVGFTIDSTGPLHVAQFLVSGSDTVAEIGDPSLLYVPAVDQRRGLYIFTTGEGFSRNHAVISMPEGAGARIDGVDVKGACEGPEKDGELDGVVYVSYTCDIEDGAHMVHSGESPEKASVPIGVFVYGYYEAGSYAYPAGSDLREVNPDVVVK
jgi:hypothetical protein